MGIVSEGTTLTVDFSPSLRIEGVVVPSHYSITPIPGSSSFPVSIVNITPVLPLIRSGALARVVQDLAQPQSQSSTLVQLEEAFNSNHLGNYLFLSSPANKEDFLRITRIEDTNLVRVDRPLFLNDPANGSIPWTEKGAVTGVVFTITKPTNGNYLFSAQGLQTANGDPYSFSSPFTASAARPRLVSIRVLNDGGILLTFSDPMLEDRALTDPAEYRVLGPTNVTIQSVSSPAANQVVLHVGGMGSGAYQVRINNAT